jgi:hypothetical protein
LYINIDQFQTQLTLKSNTSNNDIKKSSTTNNPQNTNYAKYRVSGKHVYNGHGNTDLRIVKTNCLEANGKNVKT